MSELLDRASIALWNLCTQTAIDGFNLELSDKEQSRRVSLFTKRLERFGKAYSLRVKLDSARTAGEVQGE